MKTGHFHFGRNRTFLLWLDRRNRVCDKNIGKVDNSFYLPYNLVNYKQPEGGGYGRINRVFAAEKEISVP